MTSNGLITPRQHANSVRSEADKPVTVTNRLFRAETWLKTPWQKRVPQQRVVYAFGKRLCEKRGAGKRGAGPDRAVRCRWRCTSCKRTGVTQSTETSQAHPWRPDTQTHSFPAAAWDCGIYVALFPQVITLITLEHAVCFILSADFEWGKWVKLQW